MKIENILKKFWRTVKPLSEGLDRITCFMDNVPVMNTVAVCNLFCSLFVQLMGQLVRASKLFPPISYPCKKRGQKFYLDNFEKLIVIIKFN